MSSASFHARPRPVTPSGLHRRKKKPTLERPAWEFEASVDKGLGAARRDVERAWWKKVPSPDCRGGLSSSLPARALDHATSELLPRCRRMLADKPWNSPVYIASSDHGLVVVSTTARAAECLVYGWPSSEGDKLRAALEACLGVLTAEQLPELARQTFIAAAHEARLLASQQTRSPAAYKSPSERATAG